MQQNENNDNMTATFQTTFSMHFFNEIYDFS